MLTYIFTLKVAEDTPFDPVGRQRIVVPGQLAYLSTETISFGKICEQTIQYKVVYVRNHSDSKVSFRWQTQYLGTNINL
jgi:hypothetical protein